MNPECLKPVHSTQAIYLRTKKGMFGIAHQWEDYVATIQRPNISLPIAHKGWLPSNTINRSRNIRRRQVNFG